MKLLLPWILNWWVVTSWSRSLQGSCMMYQSWHPRPAPTQLTIYGIYYLVTSPSLIHLTASWLFSVTQCEWFSLFCFIGFHFVWKKPHLQVWIIFVLMMCLFCSLHQPLHKNVQLGWWLVIKIVQKVCLWFFWVFSRLDWNTPPSGKRWYKDDVIFYHLCGIWCWLLLFGSDWGEMTCR